MKNFNQKVCQAVKTQQLRSGPAGQPSFYCLVWACVRRIPRGKVATYEVVARNIGHPRSARAVGNALNRNPYRDVPCHRVVCSDGTIGGFARGTKEKANLLKKEGVKVTNHKVAPKYICHYL